MNYIKNFLLRTAVFLFLLNVPAFLNAQENSGGTVENSTTSTTTKTTNVDVRTESGDWYTQPWVWIVGAAVFILLLVALLNGRKDSVTRERITVKKTSGTD